MDPSDDPDDILRANRSREKQYVFDLSFGPASSQVYYYILLFPVLLLTLSTTFITTKIESQTISIVTIITVLIIIIRAVAKGYCLVVWTDILPTGWAWQLELLEGNGGSGGAWKDGVFRAEPPRIFLETTPFTLDINVTNALFTSELFWKARKSSSS